jgi:hypothetical protein
MLRTALKTRVALHKCHDASHRIKYGSDILFVDDAARDGMLTLR